jgi:signal transduction histidine kinase
MLAGAPRPAQEARGRAAVAAEAGAAPPLGDLAASLAHEVLNPLAAALGMTQVAIQEGVSPSALVCLEQALESGRRVAAAIRALEAFAARGARRPAVFTLP